MNELIRHGLEAKADWAPYHSVVEGQDPRYHNRPDCEDGARIDESSIRQGTAYRQLCDRCRSAQKPAG